MEEIRIMNQNKNRLEIRLDPDSLELLNSLIARTSLTKTSLIKKALIVYASALKNGHIYTVTLKKKVYHFDDQPNEEPENKNWEEDMNKIIEELDKMPKKY